MESQFPGMDFDFLRYMDVRPENQRHIQSHYLPYFAQCKRVVDLACGDADFVDLLMEQGIDVLGVDSDDKAFAASAAKGRPVVQQDVFDWLAAQPDASVDGVFSAHLIEHLPYPKVVELIEQSYRILQPGGVILLVTPNARSVFSHLEMFYTHFGHITFYHPRLVCFFYDRAGFVDSQFGENPQTASPLFPEARRIQTDRPEFSAGLEARPEAASVSPEPVDVYPPSLLEEETSTPQPFRREIPQTGGMPWHWLSYKAKNWLSHWLVLPLLDDMARQIDEADRARQAQWTAALHSLMERFAALLAEQKTALRQAAEEGLTAANQRRWDQVAALEREVRYLRGDTLALAGSLQSVNGAFETFIWARKPQAGQPEKTAAEATAAAEEARQMQESTNEQTTTERE